MAEMAAPSHFPDRLYGLALGSATLPFGSTSALPTARAIKP